MTDEYRPIRSSQGADRGLLPLAEARRTAKPTSILAEMNICPVFAELAPIGKRTIWNILELDVGAALIRPLSIFGAHDSLRGFGAFINVTNMPDRFAR